MKIRAWVDGSWQEALKAEGEAVAPAISAGVNAAAVGLKGAYRAQVTAAGLGSRLAKTWQSRLYQPGEVTAAGLVYSKAASIIEGYATGALIQAKGSRWLAIPTDEAKQRQGRRRITPTIWEKQNRHKLQFVLANGGIGLLLGPPREKGGKARVIFILVRQVRVKQRLGLEGPKQEWENALPQLILDNWDVNGVRGEA